MNIAGQVKLMTPDQLATVHERACRLLTEKGIVFETDAACEIFKKNGCKVEGNTVYITQDVVDKCVSQIPKSFIMDAPNPDRAVTIGEGIAIHPAGGEVTIQDYKGARREPTLNDFANLQKLYQALENVNIAGYEPISAVDAPEDTRALWYAYHSFRNSDKPLLSPMSMETIQKKEEFFDLFNIYFGKEYVDNHYLTWHTVCPNSPLFWSEFGCEGIQVYAEHNQPICIVSAPMSGITSPVFLLSTLILTMAESLAGMCLAQFVKPGIPVIMSASLTYGYLRSASWECSSPDTSLMLAASIQMCKDFYKIPSRAQTGVTSSKANDYQAGMETMQSFLFSALAGVNITSQSVSSLSNLMTVSLEKTILDDELISRVRWMIDGWKFNEEQMGWDDLMNCTPSSDFLTNDSTLEHFRDYWAPTVSDWTSSDEWEENGKKDAEERAHEQVVKILEEAPESILDPETDKAMYDYIKKLERG
ncbi:MAG: trimethylamine methyltransferase family protein [Coriobacteriales bacterium]|jgi:trimethylamine--corrinoid protein Co-methyltransferase|nr:trimethylamine methyltransferase family protein [Coriobacteriales bacterium]